MIVLKIDCTKIKKELLFNGKNGAKYCDIALMENKDGEDQYGQLGFCVQSVSKEAREAGEKGPIIGNWKEVGQKKSKPAGREYQLNPRPSKPAPDPDLDPDDGLEIPF